MAEELETLSRIGYFDSQEAERFSSIPAMLNDCADWIASEFEKGPTSRRRFRAGSQWKLHLSKRVKALTGRYCDIEVSQLINAVNVAVNGDGAPENDIDAQALADLRSRHKRKA